MSTVKVTAKEGQIVVPNANKPGQGYIRVEQTIFNMENGYLNEQKRSAIIGGETEKLNRMVEAMGLKEGSTIPGKIVVIESTEKPHDKATQKVVILNKGKENESTVEITHGGAPLYRTALYTADLNKADVLLAADQRFRTEEAPVVAAAAENITA
jgi:hypothetical protein